MAILIDLSQVLISNISTQVKPNQKVEEDLVRHVCLNTLRSYVLKFKVDFGQVVLCCDSKSYWRKEYFPFYKVTRKDWRKSSNLDWETIFKVINELKFDLREFFPYKILEVVGAEADDVIGILAPRLAAHEKVLIISSDGDFKQLQKFKNVKQYNPTMKVFVKSKNPELELKEKIIRGDTGDCIPNILSPDNTFVDKIRQKPILEKNLKIWLQSNSIDSLTEEQKRNYSRNNLLINFENIPQHISSSIISEFDSFSPKGNKQTIYKYLMSKRLINLIDSIQDF